MKTLWLFDIDGTLLRAGGAGSRALNAAFAARHGLDAAMTGIDASGRTDPWLIAQVFERRLGRAATAAEIDEILEAYLPELERELTALRVLPGVIEALDWLAGDPELHHAGIATGNVERGARIKLDRAGLTARFTFGGYGCDSAARPALVARAIERGRARAGDVPAARCIVVGDTVHDIAAARACGVRVVAVCTGSDTRATLEASGADVVLDSLTELRSWHQNQSF